MGVFAQDLWVSEYFLWARITNYIYLESAKCSSFKDVSIEFKKYLTSSHYRGHWTCSSGTNLMTDRIQWANNHCWKWFRNYTSAIIYCFYCSKTVFEMFLHHFIGSLKKWLLISLYFLPDDMLKNEQ